MTWWHAAAGRASVLSWLWAAIGNRNGLRRRSRCSFFPGENGASGWPIITRTGYRSLCLRNISKRPRSSIPFHPLIAAQVHSHTLTRVICHCDAARQRTQSPTGGCRPLGGSTTSIFIARQRVEHGTTRKNVRERRTIYRQVAARAFISLLFLSLCRPFVCFTVLFLLLFPFRV